MVSALRRWLTTARKSRGRWLSSLRRESVYEWVPRHLRATAREWRERAFSELDWVEDETRQFSLGEARGMVVRSGKLQAYLKPTAPCQENHPRAANEKIVADLAADLGVAVPPVVLYRRPECPLDQEPRTCLSLVLYKEVYTFGQVRSLAGPLQERGKRLFLDGSGVLCLDLLVGNTDRNNAGNSILGTSPNGLDECFMFIDYANSLNVGDQWANGAWSNMSNLPMYDDMADPDIGSLRRAIDKLEGLDERIIWEAVSRIPDDYMSPGHKQIVIQGLNGRRSQVRAVLSSRFGL